MTLYIHLLLQRKLERADGWGHWALIKYPNFISNVFLKMNKSYILSCNEGGKGIFIFQEKAFKL